MLLSFTACAKSTNNGNSTTDTNNKKELQEIKIGILPDLDSIPLIIAEQNGYFDDSVVKITIETFKSAKDRDSALQSGNIDGAISDMLAAAFAAEGGFDVKMTSKTDGSYKLLVNADKGIDSFEKLKGNQIAISENTIIEYATDMMLKEGNLKAEDIEKVAIPQMPVRLEMLQNGKVAAATLPEPLASAAMKNGAVLLNSSDKLGINPGVLLFTTKATMDKSVEIKAFYTAYNKAVDYLNKEDKSKYIDALIEKAGFPADVKDVLVLPQYNKAVLPSEKDFANVIDWLTEKKLIKNSYKYEDLVNSEFAG
jgi:NitT/TauT family transport system substrate-binding protein